jgi:NADH-quinone oxidoreductase subunit C
MPDEREVAEEEARLLPADSILRNLLEPFESADWSVSHAQDVVTLPPQDLVPFAEAARRAGFEVLVDVTAVDWLGQRHPRFEVVINLASIQHRRRLRISLAVPEATPAVPSLVGIWPGANYAEREVYDMFGIEFEGHPDLTRILMPDDWLGYPLRKDFPTGTVPVQFKASHKVS